MQLLQIYSPPIFWGFRVRFQGCTIPSDLLQTRRFCTKANAIADWAVELQDSNTQETRLNMEKMVWNLKLVF